MSSMRSACSRRSRTCGRASAVTAPLVSFIAAQMSPIALLVPDEPMRFVPAQGAVGAGELLELGGDLGQRLAASASSTACRRRRSAACVATQPSCRLSRSIASKPAPMMHSVEPPPMSITRRSSPGLRRLRVGDAEVDQARFLAAGHDFDRVAERGLRPASGTPAAARSARTVLVAIARTRCGGMSRRRWPKRARHSSARWRTSGVEAALAVQALGQAHGFAQAVDDAQLPEHVARDHHVEAVGAQVDRREQVAVLQRQCACAGRAMRRMLGSSRQHSSPAARPAPNAGIVAFAGRDALVAAVARAAARR